MTKLLKDHKTCIMWLIALFLMFIITGECSRKQDQIFTIGIIDGSNRSSSGIKAFEQGMTELGYIEGRNIKYIYRDVDERDTMDVDAAIKDILSQNVDMIVTEGTGITSQCKKNEEVANLPILFCNEPAPVEAGLVENLQHPGGNMTGVQMADTITKFLEYMKSIIPQSDTCYVPYNPDEKMFITEFTNLEKATIQLDINLMLRTVHSVDEVLKTIEGADENIDAVILMPSLTLNPANSEISHAAIKKGIPIGAPMNLDESILIRLYSDPSDSGKQVARMAEQIYQGMKPADLPVETAEIKLVVNLNTAKTIGITIPDSILVQATTIIR